MRTLISCTILSAALCLMACGSSSPTSSTSSSSSNKSSASATSRTAKTIDHGAPASCTPAASAKIEVTSPAAGDTLIPGDTLVIRWRSVTTDFSGYIPQVSINNGTSYTELVTASILADASGAVNQCFSYQTIVPIDGSYTPGDTTNSTVIFRVKDYNSSQAAMRSAAPAVTVLFK